MPNDLGTRLAEKSKEINQSTPIIFDLSKESDRTAFSHLLDTGKVHSISDDYEEQLKEHFSVLNPSLVYTSEFEQSFTQYKNILEKELPFWQQGRWAYFPWIAAASHILEEESFQIVRTTRNRSLITKEEQDTFYNSVIGIAGLSVGNSIALSIALEGGGKYIRLADYDSLALSNTNRIRAGVENLGLSKIEMTARQIYLMNPYTSIELYSQGLTKENIGQFFVGPPKLNIIVEEIDNLSLKYLVREEAKKNRIPVVMGTDNGAGALIDTERYDIDPETPIFNGRIQNVSYDILTGLDKFQTGQLIAQYVGEENIPDRMKQSLREMGKTLVSWPQLGGAAILNGALISFCVRAILAGQLITHDRISVSLEKLFAQDTSK